MCVTVFFPGTQQLADRQDGLAEIVPADQFARREDYPDEAFGPDCCLCSIDVLETLANAGFWVTNGWEYEGGNGFTDWVAVPASVDTRRMVEPPESGSMRSTGSAVGGSRDAQ